MIGLVITGVALYVVFPSLSRVIGAWPELSTLGPGWLARALAAEAAALPATSACSAWSCGPRDGSPWWRRGSWKTRSPAALPGGDAAGAGVQFNCRPARDHADTAAGGLTVASLLGIGGLLALPIFVLPAIAGGAAVEPGLLHAALLGLAGFALFVVGGILVLATDQPLATTGRALQWLWNKSWGRHKKTAGLDRRLLNQRDQVRSVLGRNWRRAVDLVGGRLGFDFLCLLCALRSTGSDPNPSLVLLAYAAAQIIALVPITPGGLGIVEASLSGLLVLAGVSGGRRLWRPLPTGWRLTGCRCWQAGLPSLYRRRYGSVQIDDSDKYAPAEGTPKPGTT